MSKKIIMTLALVAFASSAFGAVTTPTVYNTTGTNATAISVLNVPGFNPSNGVTVGYVSDANSTVYGISSKHLSGNSIFGTTSASTSIWKQDGVSSTQLTTGNNPTAPTSPSDSTLQVGWTAM